MHHVHDPLFMFICSLTGAPGYFDIYFSIPRSGRKRDCVGEHRTRSADRHPHVPSWLLRHQLGPSQYYHWRHNSWHIATPLNVSVYIAKDGVSFLINRLRHCNIRSTKIPKFFWSLPAIKLTLFSLQYLLSRFYTDWWWYDLDNACAICFGEGVRELHEWFKGRLWVCLWICELSVHWTWISCGYHGDWTGTCLPWKWILSLPLE